MEDNPQGKEGSMELLLRQCKLKACHRRRNKRIFQCKCLYKIHFSPGKGVDSPVLCVCVTHCSRRYQYSQRGQKEILSSGSNMGVCEKHCYQELILLSTGPCLAPQEEFGQTCLVVSQSCTRKFQVTGAINSLKLFSGELKDE